MTNNPNYTHKIFSSRVKVPATEFVGDVGRIFYNEATGELRLSDGVTPHGLPISATSTVVIEFSCTIAQSNNTTTPILSLFSGTTNIGSVAHSGNSARFQNIGVLEQFQPGATTPVTISARIGAQTGSVYVNTGPAQTLGGALSSIYRIYEVE